MSTRSWSIDSAEPRPSLRVGERVYVDFGDGITGGDFSSTITRVTNTTVTFKNGRTERLDEILFIEKEN